MAVFQFIEGFYNPSRRHSARAIFRPSNTKETRWPKQARRAPTRPPKRGNSTPIVRYVLADRSAAAIGSTVMIKTNPGDQADLVTVGKGVMPPM